VFRSAIDGDHWPQGDRPATPAPFPKLFVDDHNLRQIETPPATLSNAAKYRFSNPARCATYDVATDVHTVVGSAPVAPDGPVFTPTPHLVASGRTVAAAFTTTDTDTVAVDATDNTAVVAATVVTSNATLVTLVSFNGVDGSDPSGRLTADTAGDLFGTTYQGGANTSGSPDQVGWGTVFEITKTGTAYASTPTTLVNFNSTNGADPDARLILDSAKNIFGTTSFGGYRRGTGPKSQGTVFEIPYRGGSYPSSPTTLFSFTGTQLTNGAILYPNGAVPSGVIADAAGDFFGTTQATAVPVEVGAGTVFELVNKGRRRYKISTLASFDNSVDGGVPEAGLIADTAGDLFGTTATGGTAGEGTIFEVAKTGKTPTGYANTPDILANFQLNDGHMPEAGLITDAAGDLFGTTFTGGADGDGTIFELVKNGTGGYARFVTTLVNFDGNNGSGPLSGLIMDAAGDLFGTTFGGGSNDAGTLFEVAKTGGNYASTPTTLVSFSGSNGEGPIAGLLADAAGDLFGTTTGGGANGDGTVFELTGAGFHVTPRPSGLALAAASDSGRKDDKITDVTKPTITGKGVAGDKVTLRDGGKAIGTAVVGKDGTWSVTPAAALAAGVHTLTATESGKTGTSAASAALTLTIKTSAPAPSGLGFAVAADKARAGDTFTVSGRGEAGDRVTLFDDTTAIGSRRVGSRGVWSITTAKPLAVGAHSLNAGEVDVAGNTSARSPAQRLVVAHAASNAVTFFGSTGVDRFIGGVGNDVFRFSVADLGNTDIVKGGAGNDQLRLTNAGTVRAKGVGGVETYVLANGGGNALTLAAGNFAHVTSGAITVVGGEGADALSEAGVSAADHAVLRGGAGADTLVAGRNAALTGGPGKDVFVLTVPGSTATPDKNRIVDFAHGTDKITLSKKGFSLGSSPAAATLFTANKTGSFTNPNQRFGYDTTNGDLFYEGRGNAAGSTRLEIATLTNHPTLTAGDITFVA
jgi:uncharacterized repeat protein (TIGR03803 family)